MKHLRGYLCANRPQDGILSELQELLLLKNKVRVFHEGLT